MINNTSRVPGAEAIRQIYDNQFIPRTQVLITINRNLHAVACHTVYGFDNAQLLTVAEPRVVSRDQDRGESLLDRHVGNEPRTFTVVSVY
jgi:hypothetical protein